MIHSGKSDIYGWPLGFLNRIIVFALIFLHSVQPRLRFIHPGPAGLLITPECYADPLEEGIHALPHLQGCGLFPSYLERRQRPSNAH